MTREILLFSISVIGVTAVLFWLWRRDQRHLKKRAREALSPDLAREIEQEREEARRRKERFEEVLSQSARKDRQ